MDHHRRRCRLPTTVAAALCLVLALGGRCGAAARPLMRRLHAVEESTEPASEAVLDVAEAEAPEAARWAGSYALGEGKWLPLPMPMSMPAASGLRFPPVFPLIAGASMPWLPGAPPAFAGPGVGLPALVPPYVGATRQEQLSLWASLFNPLQVRPRLPGVLGGETTAGTPIERGGVPAIASGGKAAEGETMDVPAAGAMQVAEPKWGVFLGNIDRRN
ncbi:hypothetical protein BAE44_0005531 [Dichanthelium oligosanthes]|uniref:Uncharacterized protein n=1 Tax=Dichanthelium oligosanthes TaxID=888268 RepID=A0A1E5W7Q6_9POAL|nr:hypothetical protein BAE44_0005531 [Dichanthelium oligosanthes]